MPAALTEKALPQFAPPNWAGCSRPIMPRGQRVAQPACTLTGITREKGDLELEITDRRPQDS